MEPTTVKIVEGKEGKEGLGSEENPLNVKTSSAAIFEIESVDITQLDLYSVFHSILEELKKTNIHLSMITDNNIDTSDIGG